MSLLDSVVCFSALSFGLGGLLQLLCCLGVGTSVLVL